jgi:hypothetical protein
VHQERPCEDLGAPSVEFVQADERLSAHEIRCDLGSEAGASIDMSHMSAATRLDAAREGARTLISHCHNTMSEIGPAIDAGDFGKAHFLGHSLAEHLGTLAEFDNVADLAGSKLVRVEALTEGMVLPMQDGKVVESVIAHDCGTPDCDLRIVVFADGDTQEIDCDSEIVVAARDTQ